MPTYRYECTKCAKVHEVFHGISEPALKKCPECGGRLERLISGGAGVILKGSGFHNTDYRSKSWKSAESKDAGASKPEPGAKSDAKPADGGAAPKTAPEKKTESAPRPTEPKKKAD